MGQETMKKIQNKQKQKQQQKQSKGIHLLQ